MSRAMMVRARMIAPETVVMEEAPVPGPGPGEVLLKVAVAGICGSDVHAYHGKHPFIRFPVVPGHEFAGTVCEAGPGAPEELVGQRATALPSLVCGGCHNCRTGRFNICDRLRVIGCQADGAMAEYVAVPADKVVPLPPALTAEEGALVEPLAVAVHAVRRGGWVAGRHVLVLGAGPIGLLVAQVALAYGAGEVAITDRSGFRLRLAETLGVRHALDTSEGSLASWVHQTWGPEGADLVFECAGVAATANEAIALARKGTRIVIVGVYEQDAQLKMGLVQDKELELHGTLMYTHEDYQEAMRLLTKGGVQVSPLVTHRFPLAETPEAFRTLQAAGGEAVKVLIAVE